VKSRTLDRFAEIRARIQRATGNGQYSFYRCHPNETTVDEIGDGSGGPIADCERVEVAELLEHSVADLEFLLRLIDPPTRIKVPAKLRYQVLRRAGFRCASCGATAQQAQLEVDHIRPVSQGGTNDPRNLRILCQPCNSGKGAGPA
jgi:hypothetical protein